MRRNTERFEYRSRERSKKPKKGKCVKIDVLQDLHHNFEVYQKVEEDNEYFQKATSKSNLGTLFQDHESKVSYQLQKFPQRINEKQESS